MLNTIWDSIYKEYLAGGPAWGTIPDDLHPLFLSLAEKSDFPVKRALDIGCGQGKYLKFLQLKGFQTSGLDSSESAIAMTRELLGKEDDIILADMYEYQYPENYYDMIISHATLHHGRKSQVLGLLDKIYNALVVKGKIFISLPSDDCIRKWAMMSKHEKLEDGTYIPLIGPEKGLPHSFYSKQEVDRIFSRYSKLDVTLDERGRWIITGEK